MKQPSEMNVEGDSETNETDCGDLRYQYQSLPDPFMQNEPQAPLSHQRLRYQKDVNALARY